MIRCLVLTLIFVSLLSSPVNAQTENSQIAKKVIGPGNAGDNLLDPTAWKGWHQGFAQDGDAFVCDNGSDSEIQRGLFQAVTLNQTRVEPIMAAAWSKAENVGGNPDADHSLYLDIEYMDGTPLWGRIAPFSIGSHDWERREVVVLPDKPVKTVNVCLLLRSHSGKAWFRQPELRVCRSPENACLFDNLWIAPDTAGQEGFQLYDVAAGSDVVRLDKEALGLGLVCERTERDSATFFDATLTAQDVRDHAVTLYYTLPFGDGAVRWCHNPYTTNDAGPDNEYINTTPSDNVGGGRLSRYPFGAVVAGGKGLALGIDMAFPAFYRIGYNAGTRELFVAFDLGLAPEKPSAHVRFCRFAFDPAWAFRGALDRYYGLFPESFRVRVAQQGNWMPFAAISKVEGWEDFGFRFKEGNDETKWDDEHGILTFRYTEPMTWWMPMAKELPRTYAAALDEAKRLADAGNTAAKALFASGYENATGEFPVRLLDTPWCNGAVWSTNGMPGIPGDVTDFKIKWNAWIRDSLYGPNRGADLDGEYIDSSEGYVSDELDFRRANFAAAQTPLTFDRATHRPAILRGLIAFEYVRGIERDIHAMNKLMMANATPYALCWLTPLLDVLGTETDWNCGDKWQPMSVEEMMYRRTLCKGKPYCFLMNTNFDAFSHELVEKYMKRSLAFGMFPGFFSADAATGHYFSRPERYNRDRDLFKKYVPLCRFVAEAGWEPITNARTDVPEVCVERFGPRTFTVFNPTAQPHRVSITFENPPVPPCRELISGTTLAIADRTTSLELAPEDVAVLAFGE